MMFFQVLLRRGLRAVLVVVLSAVSIFILMGPLSTQAASAAPSQMERIRDAARIQAMLSTNTMVVGNPSPSFVGQAVTFTVTVTAANGEGTPTGSVEFSESGTSLGTVTLAGGQATFITSLTTPGSHFITATYSGDATFSASTGFTNQGVTLLPTMTTLASDANPSVFGQSVTFTAIVTATNGGGTPTGTVTFSTGIGFPVSASLDSNGTGVATLSFPNFAGQLSVRATYSGDGQFASSMSDPVSQLINAASTSMVLVSSVNPSTVGQSVTFTATVSAVPPGSGTPAGTVSFSIDGNSQGDVVLNNGVATFTTSGLTAGSHTVSAYDSGNSQFSFSTASLTQVVSSSASTIQQDIQHIIETVNNLNIQHGLQISLNAPLRAALLALNGQHGGNKHIAITSLNAFVHEVEALRGKKITVNDANALIALANAVIGRLNS